MRMRTVLLRLQGPLQAWGEAAPWSQRTTSDTPTKSGVIGLVGAALGVERGGERLRELARQLTMAVRVDREGMLLNDFHTVGGGVLTAQRGRDGRPVLKVTHSTGLPESEVSQRQYLVDAAFLVALSGAAPLVEDIDAALRRPKWLLYLGRATCQPSAPIAAGLSERADPVAALREAPLHPRAPRNTPLRIVCECAPDEGRMRMDVPLAPAQRRVGPRWVREEYWTLPAPLDTSGVLDTLEG